MSIRLADATRLWGRAGGRCSICRAPLATIGIDGVLGEIAHIVGRSQQGPRGQEPLLTDQRDSYGNLVLLCPNHHTEIDRDTATWTVLRLQETKSHHESWVQSQIDRGLLKAPLLGAGSFIAERIHKWAAVPGHTWAIASLTPFELTDEAVDPLNQVARQFLCDIRMPDYLAYPLGPTPNHLHIEPSANGVTIEEFRRLSEGVGYNIELHRTGYSECVVCLDGLVDRASNTGINLPSGDHRLLSCQFLIPYFELIDIFRFQTELLTSLRSRVALPFRDMIFTLALVTPAGLCLLVELGHSNTVGRPVAAGTAKHSVVAERSVEADSLLRQTLGRLLNAFGFVLTDLRDPDGQYAPPARFSAL